VKDPQKRARAPAGAPAVGGLEASALARTAEERDLLLVELRDANERLVLTALEAQKMAEEAAAARATAESALDKLRETEAALRKASNRKDEFLAMLGHELRNPLAPILTALELTRTRPTGASVRELEVIERQVRHMVDLVDDLLDVSRITSGKIVLHRAPVEISTVIAQALEIASPLIESRRHELSVSVPESGLVVSGDSNRLGQVISNLLTNAAKYTEPGGRIALTASRDDGWVRVSVQDDGTGIPAELLPDIFDQFVQGQQSIERAQGGLGLGLAIVSSLVRLHGGEVSAQSPGRGLGSEFVVRLPVLARVDANATDAGREGDGSAKELGRAARRVLLVDDNVDATEMLALALGTPDRTVVIAHDGPAALDAVASFDPEALIIDIGLPIMDGYELARRVRERETGLPGSPRARLIALTGYGQDSDRQRSASAGIDVHLVKPVSLDVLKAALVLEPVAPAAEHPPAPPR